MSVFRQYVDTSLNDHRQVRLVVHEILRTSEQGESIDFQIFLRNLLTHRKFVFEQYKVEYCFVRESLARAEEVLSEIQLYRRPFGYIFFTVCQTTDELRSALNEFHKFQQCKSQVFAHLFIRYKNADRQFSEENASNKIVSFREDVVSRRPSTSSLISVDSRISSTTDVSLDFRFQESFSVDECSKKESDDHLFTSSLPTFTATTNEEKSDEATISILSTDSKSTKTKSSSLKPKTTSSTSIFDIFDGELKRAYNRLETAMRITSTQIDPVESLMSSIDDQFVDFQLMINSENNCSLIDPHSWSSRKLFEDSDFQNILNDCDRQVLKILFEQYLNVQNNISQESSKQRSLKKTFEAKISKRKADCCLLIGSIDRGHQEYQRAAEMLKSQNDSILNAAAIEGRVVTHYLLSKRPKRTSTKSSSFLSQSSLGRRLSMEKLLNRYGSPLDFQEKFENALQIYAMNRSAGNLAPFRLQLDASIRWCSLLMEQNDLKKYSETISQYIKRIDLLGTSLEQPIDLIYLNSYLAKVFNHIGFKRKSALYYRSAVSVGLALISENSSYQYELSFFDELIREVRKVYGIEDHRLSFPLIQKMVFHESIEISFRRHDSKSIIENVHFALETLIDHMNDEELEGLLKILQNNDQPVTCSYCNVPRLKSLDPLPLPIHLKPWRTEAKNSIFIYRPKVIVPSQQQSLHRKLDFCWVKNETVQIALLIDNYLPSTMIIDRLEFLCNLPLETNSEVKYEIVGRTSRKLLIDCVPKESGSLQIQGLSYHIWSTKQEFRFADYSSVRQCACIVDVVNELPILQVRAVHVNNSLLTFDEQSDTYNARVLRGEDVLVNLDLLNKSSQCQIDTLTFEVYVFGLEMTDSNSVTSIDLPLLYNEERQLKINLTDIYDRYLSRNTLAGVTLEIQSINIELRVNYSTELFTPANYYRRQSINLHLDYVTSINYEILDLENDENESFYSIRFKIANHLSEEILFDNTSISPSESSIVFLKTKKFLVNGFGSPTNDYMKTIRQNLPTHIECKTGQSKKLLRLPLKWQQISDEKLKNCLHYLIQSPYELAWHLENSNKLLRILLAVQSKASEPFRLEFIFPLADEYRFYNSNKICFENIQPDQCLTTERLACISSDHGIDFLIVDVLINDLPWKRMTLAL